MMGYGRILSMCAAVAITAGGFLVLASPASGKTNPLVITASKDLVVRHIGYADLNLASAAGEQTLNGRVHSAMKSLCDEATSETLNSFGHAADVHRCDSGAWAQAKPQIGQAVQRAREIAFTGTSHLAAVAITISLPE